MHFGFYPPEVNSGRMYAGAGPGPLLAAQAAWDALAGELTTAAAGYGTVIADLAGGWHGPSGQAMAAAAAPFVDWLSTTAARAGQTSGQLSAAIAAYEAAFAAHVPPPVIAANRTLLSTLVATNLLGQNTAAIAATEAHYGEMWAQDAVAMHGYATAVAGATGALREFDTPPKTTTDGAQSGSPAQAGRAAAGSTVQQLTQVVGQAGSAAPTDPLDSLNTIWSTANADFGQVFGAYSPLGWLSTAGTPWLTAMQILGLAQNVPGVLSLLNGPAPITGALGPLSGGYIAWQAPIAGGAPALAPGLSLTSALTGRAASIGGLSVPAAWTASAPGVSLVSASASLPAGTVTASAASVFAGEESTALFSQLAASSLAGRAAGGQAVRTAVGMNKVLGKAPDTEELTTATILVIPVTED